MAEHERVNQAKKGDEGQRHQTKQQDSQPLFEKSLASDTGPLSLTGTPFHPQIDEHATILSRIPFSAQRHEFTMQLHQTYGNSYVQRLLNSKVLQAKLTVSNPNGVYKQEADRAADAVTRTINSQTQRQPVEEEEDEEVMTKPAIGIQLKGETGTEGSDVLGIKDIHDRVANTVTDRIVAGQPALYLADGYSGLHRDLGIQRYIEYDDPEKRPWRFSESGKTALHVPSEAGGQELFTTTDLIMQANGQLAQAGQYGSFIRLTSGVQLPDGVFPFQHTLPDLHLVQPKLVMIGPDPDSQKLANINLSLRQADDGTASHELALWADCGRASRVVMGIGESGTMPKAGAKIGGKEVESQPSALPSTFTTIYKEAMPDFMQIADHRKFLKEGVHYDKKWQNLRWKFWKMRRQEVMKTPANDKEAKKMYWELGEEGRHAFDNQVGINLAANPEIGGAYTLVTEREMPGFQEKGKSWNFHWAGVAMKDGANNITLENYAVTFGTSADPVENAKLQKKAYDYVNRGWYFQMYGVGKKGQSFHEQHLKTGTHGTRGSTFGVKS